MTNNTWPTVEQIAQKRARGERLTAWETSVYRLNYRDDGTRYSADPDERQKQYEADNARTMATRKRYPCFGPDGKQRMVSIPE